MPRANYLFSMSVVFPLWLKANGQVLMAGFCVSTLSVTLTVGRLREHGCWPFWVSRLHLEDSRIANRLVFNCLFSDGSPLPLPARTISYIKQKAKGCQ